MAMVELSVMDQRYQAVMDVLRDGWRVTEVAERLGVARQSVHNWIRKFKQGGIVGLADQSHRPKTCPHQMSAETEKLVVKIRREHPQWGPRTIRHKLGIRGIDPLPDRSSIYRALVRRHLIDPNPRRKRRKDYRRWERGQSMELWQLDVMKIKLSTGRTASIVTGLDDHSRFCVCAVIVKHATSTAVCRAFAQALRRFGVPLEVLTDNGLVFTGRFAPYKTEVLFDRICRDNGIRHILTGVKAPTTTGKIERFHKTLRIEVFSKQAFATIAEAQKALDEFIDEYNNSRPHQSIGMVAPAERFKPLEHGAEPREPLPAESIPRPDDFSALDSAFSIEAFRRVNSSGQICLADTRYRVGYRFRGQVVKVRFDRNVVHVFEPDGVTLMAAMPRRHVKEVKNLSANAGYPSGKSG